MIKFKQLLPTGHNDLIDFYYYTGLGEDGHLYNVTVNDSNNTYSVELLKEEE